MSSSVDPEKELERLLMDLVDGELSYVQQQHLAALLHNNPALQAKYREHLLLDSLLRWEQPAVVPIPSPDSPRRLRRFPRLVWMLAAACMLLALGVSLVIRWLPDAEHNSLPQLTGDLDTGESEPQASGVAVLSRSVQAQWEPDTPRFGVGATLGVGPLHLKSGLVELEFFSGATVVIEGPARMELLAPDRIRVESGRLRAIVPQPARGFTIFSAAAELVDLGTEFGLEVNPNGGTQVHVFQGKVEVYEPHLRREGDLGQALTAGQALQVDALGHRLGIPANGRRWTYGRGGWRTNAAKNGRKPASSCAAIPA
jgi:ferric-dicitrate binding protein FerR (iron transport regulator)